MYPHDGYMISPFIVKQHPLSSTIDRTSWRSSKLLTNTFVIPVDTDTKRSIFWVQQIPMVYHHIPIIAILGIPGKDHLCHGPSMIPFPFMPSNWTINPSARAECTRSQVALSATLGRSTPGLSVWLLELAEVRTELNLFLVIGKICWWFQYVSILDELENAGVFQHWLNRLAFRLHLHWTSFSQVLAPFLATVA